MGKLASIFPTVAHYSGAVYLQPGVRRGSALVALVLNGCTGWTNLMKVNRTVYR